MKVNIITNTESAGLWQDVLILRRLLESLSVEVTVINSFASYPDDSGRGADLSIFLESLHNAHQYLQHARANWLVTNPEWYHPDQFDRYLPFISLVMCKTRHAYDVWSRRIGAERCAYTGFESRDMEVNGVEKISGFLHVIGKSESKGSQEVAEAWRRLTYPHPLTVVTYAQTQAEAQVTYRLAQLFSGNPAVRHLHNLTDTQLAEEFSLHRFVIQPSLYEGYGHVIHEAMSARCVVLTTDAPPMNSFPGIDKRLTVTVARRTPRMMVEFSHCSVESMRTVVDTAARMPTDELEMIGEVARREWERSGEFFRETFTDAIQRWEEWI